jgi:hypothetical protein
MTKVERQFTAWLEPKSQQADQVPVPPEEQMTKDIEEEEKKKKKNKAASNSINIKGATFGTVTGGTVYANTTASAKDLYVQHGKKSQQNYWRKSRKSELESGDEDSSTDSGSD